MGITLCGYDISHDVTCSGFFHLRRDIAYMLSEDIGTWYGCMYDYLHGTKEDERKWTEGINRAVNDYLDSNRKSMRKVINFLFVPDCEGKITYGTCRLICELIDRNGREKFNDISYGYTGWGAETCCGRNVYAILHSCAENKKPMVWY